MSQDQIEAVYRAVDRGDDPGEALSEMKDAYISKGHTNILLCGITMLQILDGYCKVLDDASCFSITNHLLCTFALIAATLSICSCLAFMHQLNAVVTAGPHSIKRWARDATQARHSSRNVQNLLRTPTLFTACSVILFAAAAINARFYKDVYCGSVPQRDPVLSIKLKAAFTFCAVGATYYAIQAYIAFRRFGRVVPAQA